LINQGKFIGEAPTTAREGACAPQTSMATTTPNSSVWAVEDFAKHSH
jgi:hypothetical protein